VGSKKPKSERLLLSAHCSLFVDRRVSAAAAAAVRQWRTFSITTPPTARRHYPPPQSLRPLRRCRLLARAGL